MEVAQISDRLESSVSSNIVTAEPYKQTEHVNKIKVVANRRQIRRKTFLGTSSLLDSNKEREKLFKAVSRREIEAVEFLLKSGVRPNCWDDKMRTPLHLATASGDKNIVKMLLEHGADPNRKDVVGNTSLHLAACSCNIPIVTMLLERGANVELLDNSGKNPLQLAASRLKSLKGSKFYTSIQLKEEVISVISLMQTYLKRIKIDEAAHKLDEITSQLENTSTSEIDVIGELLNHLTRLQLHRN